MADIELPPDFASSALARFDSLRAQDRLYYFPSPGEVVLADPLDGYDDGFFFEFRISPSIARKPVLAANAPERRGQGGPFIDPDPSFVVAPAVGPDHVLELSMHAMFRPHYVLHTRLFAPQTDDLHLSDMAATWAVMQAAGASSSLPPAMTIYNCGYDGGASQGHKHLQIFAVPQPGFRLFPDDAPAAAEHTIMDNHPRVPFQHFVLRLPAEMRGGRGREPSSATAAPLLLHTYRRLLAEVRRAHKEHRESSTEDERAEADRDNDSKGPCSTTAYNMILTAEWMCLIPRRRGGKNGTGAGSLGMLGVLWLRDAQERAYWTELGMTKHLVYMGLPREK